MSTDRLIDSTEVFPAGVDVTDEELRRMDEDDQLDMDAAAVLPEVDPIAERPSPFGIVSSFNVKIRFTPAQWAIFKRAVRSAKRAGLGRDRAEVVAMWAAAYVR